MNRLTVENNVDEQLTEDDASRQLQEILEATAEMIGA